MPISQPLSQAHQSVMLAECLDGLNLKQAKRVVDCTLGLGGHSEAILMHTDFDGQLLVIDQDAHHLELAKGRLADFEDRVVYCHANFSEIAELVREHDFTPDGLLYDLGVASPHFDDPERGFSYQSDGPLDMRMNIQTKKTAADILAESSAAELQLIFQEYGEEPLSKTLAQKIVQQRKLIPFETTLQLAELIEEVYKTFPFGKSRKHPATRVFQALRIAVNEEMRTLETSLAAAFECLAPGGRLVVISYHSLEDRLVKRFFKQASRSEICRDQFGQTTCETPARATTLTKKPLLPSEEEQKSNPRSRSAKLRILQKK